ncbi:MAG: flagellar hook-basal body complex protein [Verrucomicrobia bacterium]|nr:flagellar hook-basal body complex protein [Verrucomicrobiota bacterium]
MLRSLNSGVTGVRQFQTSLDVIGNNLANINTIGYKAGRVEFADTLLQTLRAATPDSGGGGAGGVSGVSAIQLGNGVELAAIKNSFTQGAVNQTGVHTDLAISGDGFFIVKNPLTLEVFATRAGDFRTDSSGFLVTNQGFRVQGFNAPPSLGATANYVDADAIGDIRLDKGTVPASVIATSAAAATAGVQNINIDSSGKVNVLLTDGSQYTRGQILLQNFKNPNALLKQGNNLYGGLTTAGPAGGTATQTNPFGTAPSFAKANTNGLGRIDSGSLEISNVDITREFSTMITTQRAFQANARVVAASDDMLQEMINVVR